MSAADYAAAFLGEFGAAADVPAVFTDAIGERLVIADQLFRDPSGEYKADKRGRGRWMRVLAEALKAPDEIWARLEWMDTLGRMVIRRRYVARILVEGETTPTLAVFERGPDGWWGVATFQGEQQTENDWRVGVRLYRRGRNADQ